MPYWLSSPPSEPLFLRLFAARELAIHDHPALSVTGESWREIFSRIDAVVPLERAA